MGAAAYIDSQAQDTSAELQKLGGAKVVLATVTNANAMATVMGGLGVGVFMMWTRFRSWRGLRCKSCWRLRRCSGGTRGRPLIRRMG